MTTAASGQRVARAHSTKTDSGAPAGFTDLEDSIFNSESLQIGKIFKRACARTLKKRSFCTSATAYQKVSNANGDSAPTWQERLWGIGVRGGAKALKPDDLPSRDDMEHGSSMFTNRRILSAKAALEPRLRCTEVDENGRVILMDGEFKKSELIAKV